MILNIIIIVKPGKNKCTNNLVFFRTNHLRSFVIELLHCITLPSILSSFRFLCGLVLTALRTTTQVYHFLHPSSPMQNISYFYILQYGQEAKLSTYCHQITAPDCWGGCRRTSTQLPGAPSHLKYPLRNSPVEKKILQNILKVTKQMRVVSTVGWTRGTEH